MPNDDLLAILRSKSRLRQLLKPLHPEEVKRLIGRMQPLLEEKRQAQTALEKEQQQRQSHVNRIKAIMEVQGLTLEDLERAARSARKPHKSTMRIFRYAPGDGQVQR